MKDSKITFSIVTVCFNSVSTIEKTIKSVISQTYKCFEYIIVDGGSNDGTLDIINKYKNFIDIIVSEPDNGIYDAFNKGIKLAKGKFISILNADDTYNTDTLKYVSVCSENHPNSIIYGDTYFIDNNDVVFSANIGHFQPENLKPGIGFMHPASFIPKSVYEKVGPYSESKHLFIASDADFLLRCFKNNIDFVKGDFKVFMRTGGLSETAFYTAHSQYLKSLRKYDVISKRELRVEQLKLIFKGIIKQFFTRKQVADFKLQLWITLVALFNFTYKLLIFNSLKKSVLKIFGFKIGRNSYVHKSTFLSLGKFIMGNNSVINPNCVIDNRGGITIGNNVSIGHFSRIYTTGHDVNCSYFVGEKRAVVIHDYVVLFSSCIIQPGVTLGKGSVVFPGAVVTKDVPAYSMVGGNPAAVVGERNKNLKYSLDYGFKFIK